MYTFATTNAAGGGTATLNLTINNSNTGVDTQVHCDSYTWIDGNTYTSSNNSASWILTNEAGCDSIVTLDLTIHYSPEIPIITQSQSTTLTTDDLYDTYNWYVNEEIYDTISEILRIDAGAYTVEVVDSNHCSAVSNPFYFGVSDVISNNPSLARIYPNPASKYINIDNIQNIESIDIFSLNGTIVKKYSYGELKDQLSLTGIQNGTYIIILNYLDGTNSVQKLIKTN